MNRRQVIFGSIGALGYAIVAQAAPAFAGKGWCKADPVVRYNGQMVRIVASFEATQLRNVSNIYFEVFGDGAFERISQQPLEEVNYTDDGSAFTVFAVVHAEGHSFPVHVDVIPLTAGEVESMFGEGVSNEVIQAV